MKRILVICVLLHTSITVAQTSQQDIEKFFYGYAKALIDGDYLDALNHWSLLDRTNTDQLKINYLNTPMKLEAGSLLSRYADQIKSGAAKLSIDTVTMNRGFARISFRITDKDTALTGAYYAVTTATVEPSLTTPLQVFSESWDQAEGRLFRLTYRDPSLFQETNMEATDQFIEKTAGVLGVSGEKMARLAETKFRVVLCESYGEVQQLTGKMALGEFARSLDAVVSKYFPSYHEIAIFLVSYANDSLPLYTLPFMEHGTATFLGGRWGRSAPVMLSLGSYIYGNNLMELDKIITYADFMGYENNSDFSHPVAGLFCKFLFDKLGREKYFRLYRQLSGSEAEIMAITPQKFHELVAAATGMKWSALEAELQGKTKLMNYAGITAGASDRGKLVYESGLPNLTIRVLEDSSHYNFDVQFKSGGVKAAMLFGSPLKTNPYRSFLFQECFPDTIYDHQRYAVIFDANEIGTYDFYANVMTGKYIVGFTAPEPITAVGASQYRFRVEKDLLRDFSQQTINIIERK